MQITQLTFFYHEVHEENEERNQNFSVPPS